MTNRAWVTLATNDSYGLGALVLAHSLRRVGSGYPAVVLITPSVTDAMRERLRAVFAEVITVDVLDSQDAAHLALLQRPELGITFTKIHCWNLTQYEKCVFLDADALVVQNCDELFEKEELSAAPDVGWPDCFNSGVFVFKPSAETFSRLITFARERGSFDGGDQGLLNSFFPDWSTDSNKRLPFLYNVTSAAFYSYLPALKHYGQDLKIIHFIGPAKPWLQHFDFESQSVDAPMHLKGFLQLWWDLFTSQVHSQLDESMGHLEESTTENRRDLEEEREFLPNIEQKLDYATYEPVPDPTSDFPWHHPELQKSNHESIEIPVEEYHDPWDIYRGHILPIPEISEHYSENPNLNEIRKFAWEQTYHDNQELNMNEHNISNQPVHHEPFNYNNYHSHHETYDYNNHHNLHESYDHNSHHNFEQASDYYPDNTQSSHNYYHNEHSEPTHTNVYNTNNINLYNINQEPQADHVPKFFYSEHNDYTPKEICKNNTNIQPSHNKSNHVYCVHMDYEKQPQKSSLKDNTYLNGDVYEDNDVYEDIRPRHPYDGFYLRHRVTIDSRGKKLCSHEIPPRSPSPISENSDEYEDAIDSIGNGISLEAEDETGVAGNLARVQPGVPLQREALDELSRRQGWESGNIDYMGADSFANIWAKISHTLSQESTKQPSPPKESSPKEEVHDLVEKVTAASLNETNDIPVPVREAANAAGKSDDSVSKLEQNTQGKVSESRLESVPILETKAIVETDVKTDISAPEETVVAVEPSLVSYPTELPVDDVPTGTPSEISKEAPIEPNISSDLHETKNTEPIPTSEMHDVESKNQNDVPKTDEVSEQPTEMHVSDTLAKSPQSSQSELIATSAVVVTSQTVSDESPDSTQYENEDNVHESKEVPAGETDTKSLPKTTSVVLTVDNEKPQSHESKLEPAVCVLPPSEPATEPFSLITETEKKETEPVISELQVEEVESAPKADEPKIDTSTEALFDVPTLDPKPVTPVQVKPDCYSVPEVPKQEKSPENAKQPVSDSPPLANTPSTEEMPSVPAAKLEERRRLVTKLQLKPPSAADPLPTPDSEFEDAASIAQSIIVSELRTPTVTSASPPAGPTSPQPQTQQEKLEVKKPDVPTPPVGAVSLSQIGVKPKTKPTTAAQIESSINQSEKAEAEPPKKKLVKKAVKKDGASSGEAPVPPPRKKEKKPKEK